MIILALQLADFSGLDVLEAVKQGENPALVIVLTQVAQAAYRERCLAAGADYFFDKASEFDDLMAVLAELSIQIQFHSVVAYFKERDHGKRVPIRDNLEGRSEV